MEARRKILEAMKRQYQRAGRVFVASDREGSFPPPPEDTEDRGTPGNLKRAIPKGYAYDPRALKPLAKMLWSMSVSLGHALTAHRQFTRLKSSTVSPDGLIGGRGYVSSVKDIRKALYEACEALSAISDTIHDEINAPHWKPKLAELEKSEADAVERLVGDAERILDDPEGDAEEEEEEAEHHGAPWHHSAVREDEQKKKREPKSEVPNGGDKETVPSQGPHPAAPDHPFNLQTKQASSYSYDRRGNSSVPVETLSGPRIEHLDRGDSDQTGPFGSHNTEEPTSLADEWSRTEGVGGEYNYPADWEGDLHSRSSASGVPDANTDPTPTKGFDFGIGQENGNQATGQAAGGYGLANPGSPDDAPGTGVGNKGVYGPRAELPHDPGGKTRGDESDSTSTVELAVGDGVRNAAEGAAVLPNDLEPGVARSDYYDGSKGSNMIDSVRGSTGLPGDQSVTREFDKDVGPQLGYRYERVDPYIKWNDTTHEMRPDPVYQRGPIEGPYAKP